MTLQHDQMNVLPLGIGVGIDGFGLLLAFVDLRDVKRSFKTCGKHTMLGAVVLMCS